MSALISIVCNELYWPTPLVTDRILCIKIIWSADDGMILQRSDSCFVVVPHLV
jgi:hypothetical protein